MSAHIESRVLWEAQRKDTDARLVLHPRVTCPGVTLQSLATLPGWRIRPAIRVYGEVKHQRRDVLFASDAVTEYAYSGTAQPANPLTDVTRAALATLNSVRPGARFNALLLNRYTGGDEYISWHSDDERTLGAGYCVATWSFGAEREFQVREKATNVIVWKGVPGVRISVTARYHVSAGETDGGNA